ncbi:ArnT family glycosyltransferase [Rasiella sp. SM2506]|uniref:ArnT family glycosyltransferase n=1 Tax=Rasiella sp. SM2506 TaxID=3423914 RepID=UPI003D7BC725
MKKNTNTILLIFTIFLIVEFVLCINVPFFWDGMTKVGRAEWIYDHNFSSLIVPTEINSGHPPLWITLLAGSWALLGKSLWVSRLLLLVVNWGVLYQLLLLCKKLFADRVSIFWFFLLCIEATLLTQTTSLNNDMLLLFFVLLSCNAILSNRWFLLTLALAGVLMTNLRGIYCIIGLGVFHGILYRYKLVSASRKIIWSYLLACIVFGAFVLYQYSELGWAIISQNESYAKHRKTGSWLRVLHKGRAFLVHAFEYGRIFLWVPLAILLGVAFKKYRWKLPSEIKIPFIGLAVFTAVFILGFVPFTNPIGPRYLMICYIFGIILLLNLVYILPLQKWVRKATLIFVAIGFLTGHLWVYPATTDQAWDSTLAYLNYYPVKSDMLQFLDEKNIDETSVGTNLRLRNLYIVPALKPNRTFAFKRLDLDTNEYVLFSNIENDTSPDQIETLRTQWTEIKSFSQMGVFITLYKNPNFR